MLLAALAVLVTADVLLTGPLTHLDHVVHRFADRHVQGGVMDTAHTVHLLGQRWTLLIAIVPLAILAGVRGRSFRYPLVAFLVMLGMEILQYPLKNAIPRSYPEGGVDVLFKAGDAYPSGHTLNAFVFVWLILELAVVAFPALAGWLTSERRWSVALVAGILTALAVTVADYHWLTDALASLGIGPILLSLLVVADPFRARQRERALSLA